MTKKILGLWKQLPPAWQFALSGFVLARLALTFWSLVIFSIFPMTLQNLDLFGEPVLAIFDLTTSERFAYLRQVDNVVLTFQAVDLSHMKDMQTGSIWSLREGRAVLGAYAGRVLNPSVYSAEQIFPYQGVSPEKSILLAVWQRFDANWYLKIATRGYGNEGSTVYFPVYPLLIRAFVRIFGNPMLAAILISNFALIGVLVLLYYLTAGIIGVVSARRAIVYILLFPTAFFMMAAYTESLFLLFTLGSLLAAMRRQWPFAIMLGTLAALTRLQGVLVIAPLAYMLWRQVQAGAKGSNPGAKTSLAVVDYILRSLPLLVIQSATIIFLAFTNLSLLNAYRGELHAKFVLPWDNVLASISLLMSGQGSFVDALNLIITFGLGVMMFVIWKKLPFEYTLYSLLMLVAPMLRMTTTQPLVSMSRYALAVFPMFIVWADWGQKPWVNRAIVYLSLPLQLYLSAQFFLWGWVA